MEWIPPTPEAPELIVVFAAALAACVFCCLAGFHLRGSMERRIREEYRALFGVCRRSMAHPNEYNDRPEVPVGQDLDTSKTTEFRPGTRKVAEQVPVRTRGPRLPLPPASRGLLTVEHDMSKLARSPEATPSAPRRSDA